MLACSSVRRVMQFAILEACHAAAKLPSFVNSAREILLVRALHPMKAFTSQTGHKVASVFWGTPVGRNRRVDTYLVA